MGVQLRTRLPDDVPTDVCSFGGYCACSASQQQQQRFLDVIMQDILKKGKGSVEFTNIEDVRAPVAVEALSKTKNCPPPSRPDDGCSMMRINIDTTSFFRAWTQFVARSLAVGNDKTHQEQERPKPAASPAASNSEATTHTQQLDHVLAMNDLDCSILLELERAVDAQRKRKERQVLAHAEVGRSSLRNTSKSGQSPSRFSLISLRSPRKGNGPMKNRTDAEVREAANMSQQQRKEQEALVEYHSILITKARKMLQKVEMAVESKRRYKLPGGTHEKELAELLQLKSALRRNIAELSETQSEQTTNGHTTQRQHSKSSTTTSRTDSIQRPRSVHHASETTRSPEGKPRTARRSLFATSREHSPPHAATKDKSDSPRMDPRSAATSSVATPPPQQPEVPVAQLAALQSSPVDLERTLSTLLTRAQTLEQHEEAEQLLALREQLRSVSVRN
eukprot:scaffold1381_cov386-Prasinococcus_capsulatus_cf.AAC.10